MTEKEKTKRKEDERVQWIKNNMVKEESGKDYVFVSYKSDDWEKVLGEIVYPLMKDHHLNVYFDGDFDFKTDHWIKQFPIKQADEHCKAVLCFFTNKYFKSYATLLEVMNATVCNKPIIPVNIEKIDADEYLNNKGNTGLGQRYFQINEEKGKSHTSENYFWDTELKEFNKLYKKLKEMEGLGNEIKGYKPFDDIDEDTLEPCEEEMPFLKIHHCGNMMSVLLKYSAVNINDGSNTDIITSTIGKINDKAGKTVFTNSAVDLKPTNTYAESSDETFPDATKSKLRFTPYEDMPEIGEITLAEFSKKYDNNSFRRDSFNEVSFVAMDKNGNHLEQYDVDNMASAASLSWKLLMKLLDRMGEKYVEYVNDRNKTLNNPVFVRTNEKKTYKLAYKETEILPEWSMCTNYSQYTWLTILKNRLDELRSFNESLQKDSVSNDETISPRPLKSAGYSGSSVMKSEGKTKKTSLSDMIESEILAIGDEVFVKGEPGKIGTLAGGNEISYNGQKFSLNKFVPEVLGPGSRNAYDYVYHKKTNKTLNELRPENN